MVDARRCLGEDRPWVLRSARRLAGHGAGRLSTAVVQRFCKPKVGGSIPSAGTTGLPCIIAATMTGKLRRNVRLQTQGDYIFCKSTPEGGNGWGADVAPKPTPSPSRKREGSETYEP